MKTSLTRAAALSCALYAGTGLSSPALAQTKEIAPPVAYSLSPTGVNLQDGRFTYFNNDLSIGTGPLAMTLSRSFLGLGTSRSNYFGANWSHSFDMHIYETVAEETGTYPDTWIYDVHVVLGARTVNFQRYGSNKAGTYEDADESPIGYTLSYSSATNRFTLTDPEGSIYTFAGLPDQPRSFVAESIVQANGLRLDFTYVGNQLESVISNSGYGFAFDYEAGSRRVVKACGINLSHLYTTATSDCPAAAPAVTYQYGSWLSGFTDASGNTQAYEYGGHQNFLTCIRRPATGPCEISNVYQGVGTTDQRDDRVASQTTATGESYSYSYNRPNPTPLDPPGTLPNDKTTVTGPAGSTVTTFVAYKPTSHSDELGRRTDYAFTGTFLTSVTYPEGNIGQFPVDARGNHIEARQKAKPGTGLADLVRTASYPSTCANPKTCNSPDYVIDAKGNRTDFTYDPNHGGVLTETGPAVNGVRPQKRFTYQQRYAWVKNSSGAMVQATSPIWVLTQTAQCQTQASCAGGADEVRTVFEYGAAGTADSLLVKGTVADAGRINARTCSAYDANGNKISETSPLAGLSSCP